MDLYGSRRLRNSPGFVAMHTGPRLDRDGIEGGKNYARASQRVGSILGTSFVGLWDKGKGDGVNDSAVHGGLIEICDKEGGPWN